MTITRLAAAALVCGFAAALPAADNSPPPGFTALFNGKDFEGWQGNSTMKERATKTPEELAKLVEDRTKIAKEQWSVVDGAFHLTPPAKGTKVPGISLQTVKDYGNFELLLDWRIEPMGDSGIYIRGQPQVQIWDSDTTPGAKGDDKGSGSGGLWNNPAGSKGKMPLKKADKPAGEWNTFHIVMVGDEVTVKLNGETVVDKAPLANYWDKGKPLPAKGPVELQFHGDPLWFKNIYIKELP